MNASYYFSLCMRIFLGVALTLIGTTSVRAQKPPAIPVNPQAPTLKPAVPLGMQRGTTLDLTLTGTNLAEPTGLWTSFPAKVTIPTEGNNGKDNAKLLVRVEVPKDAPIGFHAIRLATRRGMSNLRLFCIDDLPQVSEVNTNRATATAQAVPVPCVVVGKADAETTDYFKISVTAGQRVSFEILGRRLGSLFDPQLQLLDAHTGRELPGAYSNDAPGLQTDARLTHTFKTAGDYLVAVRDVSYRGGEDFHYRLRIGDFPCATTTLPLAVKRGSKVAVRFAGPTVEGVAPVEVTAPTDPAVEFLAVAPRGANGLHGWPVNLAVSDLDETLEKEPNNEAAKANRLAVPGAITARFEQKGDGDSFVFTLKKGARSLIEAHTHEHGSPTEVYMILRDGKGTQLQASNPTAAPRLDFTPPADGDYTLHVEHLHLWGGPDEVYRVTVTPFEQGFDMTVALDRFNVGQGGKLSIPVLMPRRDFGGPIEISVLGPKGISGKLAVAAGKAPPANQPIGTLVVNVADDVPVGPYAFQIQGKATINGKVVTKLASVRTVVSQGMANLPLPPRGTFASIGLAVTEKPPFTLTAKLDAPSYMPGKPATLTVTAVRSPGFSAEIALSAAGLPPGVTAALKNIPANQNEIKVPLTLTPKAKIGKAALLITGKAKHQGRDISTTTPAVPLTIKK
ncbi:MAG TPA: PPC domain-containing protein [Gemmataceae bacterium]|nr:PPC domain-containing protein [Gemmataceae bacterium]